MALRHIVQFSPNFTGVKESQIWFRFSITVDFQSPSFPLSCKRMSALVAPSGECLRGEGLVWLIGAVVCSLAAYRGSNYSLARAMADRI